MRYARHFERRTKIVCTIGPASGSAFMIERLIKSGMNVARLNLSHGTRNEHVSYIQTIRKLAQRLAMPVAILMDLPGPKYRTGNLSAGSVVLKKGSSVVLTTKVIDGNATLIPVNHPTLPQDVKAGDTVLLDDGALQLKVLGTRETEVDCQVVVGGVLTPNRGIVVPGMRISGPFVSDQLRQSIDFAVEQKPDYIALSFVSRTDDVEETKAILHRRNCDIPIIAKIERGQAVTNFDNLLVVSD
ncbi:MAG: pyruvate kinase, partial [Chloroflexi bacterium]|nr:pyruvate kinase [Chloroflexota bacterium]